MLKSLFEASIDKLNISADMKDAIKKINNICLEAEGQETDPSKQYNYEAYPKGKSIMKEDSDERVAAQKKDAEAKKNGQEKDTSVKGVDPDVEKTAKNGWNYDVSEEINKNSKEDEKPAKEEKEEKKKEDKEDEKKEDEKKEDSKEESKEEDKADDNKEEQPAQNSEPEENKGTQASEPNTATQTAEAQPAQQKAAPKAAPKYRADVATVQFFLRATEPQTNLVGDGILGPKTITAIQQTEDIKPTGKMDPKTQEAFNKLLEEAKQKVIPIQKQLGVTADGLIGKQTLTAMQKANMHVASVFSENPTAQQTQVANNQGANSAANQGNTNVLANKFNESEAQKLLNSKNISQREYNIWKTFGIAPIYQRSNPQETQTQIAQIRKKQQEANVNANANKSLVPQNDVETKFYNQTVKNYISVYTQLGEDEKTAKNHAIRAAQNALIKFRSGKWANGNQQNAQPQQAAQANAQPQQAAQANAQPAQQQAQRQPAQKAGTRQNPNVQYLSGTVSTMNLPPDERKVYDDAVKKFNEAHKKMDEQMRLTHGDEAGRTAVLQYRQSKVRPMNG